MTVVAFAPWEPDKADLNGQTTGDILNVLPSTGSYLPFPDFAPLSPGHGFSTGFSDGFD